MSEEIVAETVEEEVVAGEETVEEEPTTEAEESEVNDSGETDQEVYERTVGAVQKGEDPKPAPEPPKVETPVAAAPATPPAAVPAEAQLQQREAAIQQQEETLNTRIQEYNRATNDPLFQQTYQEVSRRMQGGAAAPVAGQEQQGALDALADFVPETEEGKVLLEAFQGMKTQLDDAIKLSTDRQYDLHSRLGGVQLHNDAQQELELNQVAENALDVIKANYPGATATPEDVSKLENTAAALLTGFASQGVSITVDEAYEQAAQQMSHGLVGDQAVAAVQQQAGAAVRLGVPTPRAAGTGTPSEGQVVEEAFAEMQRKING